MKSFTTDVSGSDARDASVMLTRSERAERAGARDASVRLSELVRDTMTLQCRRQIQQSKAQLVWALVVQREVAHGLVYYPSS